MKIDELYRFAEGDFIATQTSSDSEIVFNSETYVPYPIGRTAVDSKAEMSKATVDVKMSLANPLAQRYLGSSIDTVVTLTIFQVINGTPYTFWKGRIASVKTTNKEVTLSFESIFTSLRRPGLRARYQKTCRHALYGQGCFVDPEDHDVVGMVSAVSGNTVTVPGLDAYPDGRFRGGMLRAPSSVVRFVVNHSGNVLTLSRPFQELIDLFAANGPGVIEVKSYPGCQHNLQDCETVFDNLLNYGGFPWIPSINPMGGVAIA